MNIYFKMLYNFERNNGVSPMIEHLPSLCAALASLTGIAKDKQIIQGMLWWLMTVILSTQEVEVRWIEV
jgi:hypothetical protein